MTRELLPLVVLTLGLNVACSDDRRTFDGGVADGGVPEASIGVGATCVPEVVPEGGFSASETYLETSSVQCRTRVCMVHLFEGDPRMSREDCLGAPSECDTLPTDTEIEQSVYCTCRCAAPNPDVPVCDCGSGFRCEGVLDLGGDGIRGSYCVRDL